MTLEEHNLLSDAIRFLNGEGESFIELKAMDGVKGIVEDGEDWGQRAFDWMMKAEAKGTLEKEVGWDELPHSLNDVITAVHSYSNAATRAYAREIAELTSAKAGPGQTFIMPKNIVKRTLPAFSVGYATRLATLLLNRPNRVPTSPKDIQIALEAVHGLEEDFAREKFNREKPPR